MATASQAVSSTILLPSAVLTDTSGPRQLYFAFFPSLLLMAALFGWTMGNEAGMVLSAAVGTVVALFTLWDWVFRHGPTRLSTLLGMSLLLGYGGGALNTWFTLPRTGTVAAQLGLDEAVLARGMAAVLISSASLYFVGEFLEKPVFAKHFRVSFDPRTQTLIYLAPIGMIAGYVTHALNFGGVSSAGMHVSIPGLFLSWLFPHLTALTVAAFVSSSSTKERFFSGLSAIVLFAMFPVLGRRNTIYTTIEILFVVGLVGFRWRQRLFRNVLILLMLTGIIVGSALSFMLLRIAAGHRTSVTVNQRIETASKMVKKGGTFTTTSKATQKNIQSRTFIISFLASVLDASFRTTPALGADAIGLSQLAIPYVLYPDKNLWFTEEGLVDYQFHFSFGDQPNSILTAGATDFGLLGMILYPLLIVAISRFILEFMARRVGLVPLTLVALSFIFLMLQTESTLTSYIEGFRDNILFGFIVAILMALPTPRLSR